MNSEDIILTSGENIFQKAEFSPNDKMIDYETSANFNYREILSVVKGLGVMSEFYDVKAACTVRNGNLCASALGQSAADAVQKVVDSDPIDYINSVVVLSCEVDSETAKFFKETNLVAATGFTKKALEIFELRKIRYITVKTPLKDYKKYLSNDVKVTPLGTLTETPNLSELDKDNFKVVSKTKPDVEQIEDAVFAWKVAKYCRSQAIVIAKNLKTNAISQGLNGASVEYALDYSCDMSKEAVLASDMSITVHDVDTAAQGRIGLIIVPFADKNIINQADKYSIALITTGFENLLI